MNPQPTSRLLTLSLIASIAALLVLLAGCFGTFGVVVWRTSPVNGGNAVTESDIALDGGRFQVFTTWGRQFGPSDATSSTQLRWQRWHPRMPDMKRAVAGFDAHGLPVGPGTQAHIFAFPLWCIIVPLTAATIFLGRKLKSRQKAPGFAVIDSAAASASS